MKKYITVAALLAAGTAFANAEVTSLIDVDFTKVSAMPHGWTSGQWTTSNPGESPHFSFGNNGATVRNPWKQNYLETTDLTLSLAAGVSYTIEFTTYSANTDNYQALFYLSSTNYSIALGNSYNSNKNVYVGDLDSAIDDEFVSFQDGKDRTVIEEDQTLEGLTVDNGLDYSLTLTEDLLSYSISDGTTTKNGSFTFSATDSFSKIGFVLDGATGAVGVKNVSVVSSAIPEPSAFGLLAGLGALALVASRRRRK